MPSAHELTEPDVCISGSAITEVVVFQKAEIAPEHFLFASDVALAGLAVLHIVPCGVVGEGVGVLLNMHEMSQALLVEIQGRPPFPASCAVPSCAQQRQIAPGVRASLSVWGHSSHSQQPTLGSAFFLALHFAMPSAHELTEPDVFQK